MWAFDGLIPKTHGIYTINFYHIEGTARRAPTVFTRHPNLPWLTPGDLNPLVGSPIIFGLTSGISQVSGIL